MGDYLSTIYFLNWQHSSQVTFYFVVKLLLKKLLKIIEIIAAHLVICPTWTFSSKSDDVCHKKREYDTLRFGPFQPAEGETNRILVK